MIDPQKMVRVARLGPKLCTSICAGREGDPITEQRIKLVSQLLTPWSHSYSPFLSHEDTIRAFARASPKLLHLRRRRSWVLHCPSALAATRDRLRTYSCSPSDCKSAKRDGYVANARGSARAPRRVTRALSSLLPQNAEPPPERPGVQ